ncbi:hypothetical protein [Actinoplanes awajinensis]|nr:hypothetical protein [Actinoplanes awajinensis]
MQMALRHLPAISCWAQIEQRWPVNAGTVLKAQLMQTDDAP